VSQTLPNPWTGVLGETEPGDPISERILDAALHQFQTYGLRRSTVEDVAKRARVTRVTVYRRFPNKGDLTLAVIHCETKRALDAIEVVMTSMPTAEERFVEGFVVTLRTARNHPLLKRLLDTEPELVLPYLTIKAAPVHAIARALLVKQLRRAQRAGTLGTFDPDVVAELLVRALQSFLLTPEGFIDLGTDRKAWAFARRYLFAPLVAGEARKPRTGA
jgi:AcrR family transcriptional regulator